MAIQHKGEVPTFVDCRKPALSDAAGGSMTSAVQAVPGKSLTLRFHDGERRATVARDPAGPAETKRAGHAKGRRPDQGTLL
ncbi:MAG: hypothetical protein WD673_12590 [Alphaproteobacteria bacterium]